MNALTNNTSIQNAALLSITPEEGNPRTLLLQFDRPVRINPGAVDLKLFYGPNAFNAERSLAQVTPTSVRVSTGGAALESEVFYGLFIPEECRCLAVLDGGRLRAAAAGFIF